MCEHGRKSIVTTDNTLCPWMGYRVALRMYQGKLRNCGERWFVVLGHSRFGQVVYYNKYIITRPDPGALLHIIHTILLSYDLSFHIYCFQIYNHHPISNKLGNMSCALNIWEFCLAKSVAFPSLALSWTRYISRHIVSHTSETDGVICFCIHVYIALLCTCIVEWKLTDIKFETIANDLTISLLSSSVKYNSVTSW